MSENPIHFGTSGWRSVIAEDFTYPNVRLATAGIAHYLLRVAGESGSGGRPRVLVGYDTRFMSEQFAATAAEILNSHGVETLEARRPDPTPAISHEVIATHLDGAINITASHNPAEYSGLKFSGADGAPALPEATQEIESNIERVLSGELPMRGSKSDAGLRQPVDPRPRYLEEIRKKVDLEAITKAWMDVAYDPLYGTGRGYVDALLGYAGARVHTLHDHRDVLFSGVGSEPTENNLSELSGFVKDQKCAVGLSTDGDADRFGIVDSDGTWIQPNYVLALVADYLIEVRKMPGGIARSVATTHLLDAVAKNHGVPLYQTPVGFKYIGQLVKEDKIVLGGEESAGLTIGGHLPEKDGILAGLLVVEMVARRGLSLRQQLEALFKKVGAFYNVRINLHLAPDVQQRAIEKLKRDWDKLDSYKVAKIDRMDGLKMILQDGSWVLMRPSGTEPVVRVYCEASSLEELDRLESSARAFVLNP